MGSLKDLGATAIILARNLGRWLRPLLRALVMGTGLLALLMFMLACTRVPFDAHRWLGSAAGECTVAPEVIVVLGGSGMPSGPELVRMHRTAELATQWPTSRLLVVHPGPPFTLNAMADELLLRGVEAGRISVLNEGNSTWEQALNLSTRMDGSTRIALVTAPENMYRTVLSFRKAGFVDACGAPAWDHAMLHNFEYGHASVGGKAWVPDVSGSPRLRYTFWNYLKLEITCMREYVAIGYYWLNGWI